MMTHILVATDFNLCSLLAVQHTFNLTRALGGHVTLLHVREPETEEAEPASLLLQKLGRQARRTPECLVRPGGTDVAGVILQVAADMDAELIVMGAHGRQDAPHPVLGRTVQQVMRAAVVPVQVVPGTLKLPHPGGRWQVLVGS
ncbi:universal stress protein (plasmid) [Deinococcus sp. KNUC1210]|uniref:universal stress protein n=1 Tax=Deinococcus sp. KNUC1210 TaxID=2917691 RepID=UPI001EF1598A|nr:universal stress protein [Deinococcus sp. KNUC1210]ULH13916.1 universal stress protein [Deinococcus sp. KNUC1210]